MNNLFILSLPVLLSACLPYADDPRQVAEMYWKAMKNGDTEIARTLVSRTSQQDYDKYLGMPVDEKLPIGDVNLGAEQTTITTILYPGAETGAAGDHAVFDTVLVLENGKWKIDASQTVIPRPVPGNRELNELADELSESMQDNINSLEEAMNEGLQMMDEALREGSRDLGESMLKGMEEMNRALRESIEDMKRRREQQQAAPDREGEGLI